MRKNSLIKKATYGICNSIIDLLIWQVALVGTSVGKSGTRGVYRAFQEADDILEDFNHRTVAQIWRELTKKRLITYQKRQNLYSPQITAYGRKKLAEILPQYHQDRPWDKKIYLITYDVPQNANQKRDKLRSFLKQIDAKLLQQSIFLTPYNPRQLIDNFIQKHKIPGTIIVSDVGKDGGIGETSLRDLLVNLYHLEDLNNQYEEFIKNTKTKSKPPRYLLFEYLSILKGDPQLPFELLPKHWLGNKAYLLYSNLRKMYNYNSTATSS